MAARKLTGVCPFVKGISRRCRLLDQRFEPDEEAQFTKSLEPNFIFPCTVSGLLVVYLCFSASVSTYSNVKASDDDVRFMLVMVGARVFSGLMSISMVVACLLKRGRCSLSINLEYMCLAWTFSLVFTFGWFNAWHGPLLFGKDPNTTFSDWVPVVAEGYSLLYLSTVVSGSCLIVPVRCHLSWVIPAFGMGTYICVTYICGSASSSYLTASFASLSAIILSTLWGSYKNQVFLRREWLAQQKVGTQQDLLESQYDGVCRVLNLLCDCMIRLGSSLELLEPNARFAAMLMKGNVQSLMGTCIKDYIPDATDKELFSDMVVGKKGIAGLSSDGMFHVNFKDSYGKEFPVDIYHTRIANKEDIEYLIGIVENSVREPGPAIGTPKFDYHHQEPNLIGFSSTQDTLRPGPTAVDEMQTSSGSSTVGPISGEVYNLGEVSVDVIADPFNGFPILRCTPGFTALSGPITEGEQLTKFIVDSSRRKRSIEDMLNVFFNTCQNVVFEDVVFRKPNASIEYAIAASALDFAGITLEDENQNGSEIVLRVVFHGIRQQRRSRRSRHSRRILRSTL